MKYVFGLIVIGVGVWLIIDYSNWQTFLGIMFMMWGNNLQIIEEIDKK